MNEIDFIAKKRADWNRLEELILKANGIRGVRALSSEEMRVLGPLYRRASSDLAYARVHSSNSDIILHLNSLVGRAHALMFEAETTGNPALNIFKFYFTEFPTLLQKRVAYFLIALLITTLGGIYGYAVCISNKNNVNKLVPEQFRESAKYWMSGDVSHAPSIAFSAELMTHNHRVGMLTFATGPAAGIPTSVMLFDNGVALGVFAALMTYSNRHATFWPGIVPHGVSELTAIFICGAAGLLIGKSVMFPGRLSRFASLKLGGIEAVKLALGTIPMFIFAGIIEGMFSRLPIAAAWRYAFAIFNGIVWYCYLFIPRPAETDDSLEPKLGSMDNLPAN